MQYFHALSVIIVKGIVEKVFNMNKNYIIGLLATVLAVSSCSKGDDMDYESGIRPGPSSDVEIVNSPTLKYSFRGVWAVDEVLADTLDVDVRTFDPSYNYGSYVAFYDFPFKAIAERVMPEVKISTITNDTMVKMDYRCVGESKSTVYLELSLGEDYSFISLPFVVTSDKGETYAVTAYVAPSQSMATVDINGETFSCLMIVPQVEIKVGGETTLRKFEPEMKLKYTSIKRIESTTSGK